MYVWQDLPGWLKSIGYQNPSDPNKTSLHRAWKYDKGFFEFLPEKGFLDHFQAFMSLYRVDRAEFLDIFPAEERLITGADENGVMLVDVGGGRGHGSYFAASPTIDRAVREDCYHANLQAQTLRSSPRDFRKLTAGMYLRISPMFLPMRSCQMRSKLFHTTSRRSSLSKVSPRCFALERC